MHRHFSEIQGAFGFQVEGQVEHTKIVVAQS